MKTISEMSKECGCTYESVYRTILKLKMIPMDYVQGRKKRLYHRYQVDLVYKTLYFERKCNMVIFESKMNHVETKEEKYQAFREFKLKTYTR